MEEFEKPKVHFENLEKDLLKAINSGRYTVPYEKQVVLSDEEGQKIRKEIDTRAHLPWLLFDFDDTLHHLNDNTFFIFQDIIKKYSGVEIPIEAIKRQRLVLKSVGEYQYQNMLLALIKELNPKALVSFEALTELYKFYKSAEPFIPKMSKEDFLMLRSQYRIGVITDGETFESKLPKIKAFYGIDIDGYVNNGENVLKKPSPQMFHQFCKIYNVEVKPIAYIGDSEILDGGFAKNVNLPFIHVDPMKPKIDMQKIKKELDVIEEQRKRAIKKWEFLRNTLPTRAIKISSQEDKRDLNFK
ncbi:HAD family hydrolase [Legionella taurinensis]|nr:HAD family hydrolase [Legionella taurinensis]MDX1837306.1 HAD family hydrolase [Legionella taurinensis]